MQVLILLIHVFTAISIIVLVLLQHGKGADAGAAFGSGSSNSMFGSTGALPFLIKLTAILAAIFFSTSLILSYWAKSAHQMQQQDLMTLPATGAPSTASPNVPPNVPKVP